MSRRLLVQLVVAVGIVMMIAGGCGGGGGRTVSTSSLTKAEFIKRAEAICARGRIRSLRYQTPRDPGQSERDAMAEGIKVTLLPAIQEVIDEIYALGAPRGEEARVETFLVALQEAVSVGKELRAPSFERLVQLLAQPGKLAQEDGLESCIYAEPS